MPLTVVEVLGRSTEGRTRPYICRCDDGEVYFVKGRSATRHGLIAELICAGLAKHFGLPIAPTDIATVPTELIESDLTGWLVELGPGEVFASRRVNAVDLTEVHRNEVPRSVRRDVLAFDWWVNNGDRTLTAAGGNPNLMWNPSGPEGTLVVIDHNLAFDPDFSKKNFVQLHVFAEDIPKMFSDFIVRAGYEQRFAEVLGGLDEICDTIPVAWEYIDVEQTLPTLFAKDNIRAVLDRAFTEDFWYLPK